MSGEIPDLHPGEYWVECGGDGTHVITRDCIPLPTVAAEEGAADLFAEAALAVDGHKTLTVRDWLGKDAAVVVTWVTKTVFTGRRA